MNKPYMFIAEMISENVVQYRGARFEVFLTHESANLVLSPGDRVQCMLVREVSQIFIVAMAESWTGRTFSEPTPPPPAPTAPPPWIVPLPPPPPPPSQREYGTLISNETRAVQEYQAGVRVVHQELAWEFYETANGTFNTTYINQQIAKLNTFKAAGMRVVLGSGIQYPPNWAYDDFGDSRYKNQFGVESGLNTTFNQVIRTQVEQYISRINSDLGLNNYSAVRIGSGYFIETVFPGMDDGAGHTNSYWGWDANASGGVNRPSTIPTRPHAAWVPGSTSITPTQAGEWLDWYMNALVDGINWQVAYYKSLGFTGDFHLCMPGLGTNPRQWDAEVAARLDGSADSNRTLGRGAVYHKIVDKLTDRANVVCYESGIADDSGIPANNMPTAADASVNHLTDSAVDLWSGTRWKVFNANRYGMKKGGENPGQVDFGGYGLSMLNKMGEFAYVGGLAIVMFAHDDNLFGGAGGITLADYAATISTWP